MSRQTENCAFVCINCGAHVLPLTNGSYRNHCPFCLYSLHVDIKPGDRLSECKALMEPIALHHTKKGWQITHQCEVCGKQSKNRIAEYTVQPDSIEAMIALFY